jgi:N-acetylglutamate synthase-like GNAT family acetyltransferase
MSSAPSIIIRNDIRHGDLGSLIYLHGVLYPSIQGFDLTFEMYVAETMIPFFKNHSEHERLWLVEANGTVKGCIAIVRFSEAEAQLRWFLLHPDLRGMGIGKRLVQDAVAFAKNTGYQCCHLWTTGELKAAGHLYRSVGFECVLSEPKEMWGVPITEEKYFLEF